MCVDMKKYINSKYLILFGINPYTNMKDQKDLVLTKWICTYTVCIIPPIKWSIDHQRGRRRSRGGGEQGGGEGENDELAREIKERGGRGGGVEGITGQTGGHETRVRGSWDEASYVVPS